LYKICTYCKGELEIVKFAKRKDRENYQDTDLLKYNTVCFECASLKIKLKFVGIDKPYYDQMRILQDDCCKICGKHEIICRNGRNIYYGLNIDHCHETGKVRGLLCNSCNLIIGHAKDCQDILHNAINYLQNTKI